MLLFFLYIEFRYISFYIFYLIDPVICHYLIIIVMDSHIPAPTKKKK